MSKTTIKTSDGKEYEIENDGLILKSEALIMIVKTKKGIIEKAFNIVFMKNYETATIDVIIFVRDTKGEIVKVYVPIEDIYEVVEGENNGNS